ncbi:putative PEP-binding protein [Nonomuraea sp. NPDC050790]|uniref:putative PEP-binding protein n=1 Tax=Nonomuraea sp. NPDC050790 TaxID=3364371 RepID=UPI00378B2B8C
MLAQPDTFADQFRALLRAGAPTDLRVMIPMVADLRELRACRRLLHRAADDAGLAPPPLGIMVELPEAVAVAATVAAAHRHGRTVSVCGDAAAHPLVVPLLLGLGCDSLSVAPSRPRRGTRPRAPARLRDLR